MEEGRGRRRRDGTQEVEEEEGRMEMGMGGGEKSICLYKCIRMCLFVGTMGTTEQGWPDTDTHTHVHKLQRNSYICRCSIYK